MSASEHTPATSNPNLISLIIELLRKREHFRFQTEGACSRRELLGDSHRNSIYASWFNDNASLEHALCNAYAFNSVMQGQPPGISTLIENWMLLDGPGYDRFQTFLKNRHFTAGKRLATHRMVDPIFNSGSESDYMPYPYEFLYHDLWGTTCPVHYMH